jgi:hypothetical protein
MVDAGENQTAPVAVLSFEDIAAVDDIKTEVVDVPAWGGGVKVRALTRGQQHDIRAKATDRRTGNLDEQKSELLLLQAGISEPSMTLDQVKALNNKSAAAVSIILLAIMQLNGMDAEGQEAAAERFPAGHTDTGPAAT